MIIIILRYESTISHNTHNSQEQKFKDQVRRLSIRSSCSSAIGISNWKFQGKSHSAQDIPPIRATYPYTVHMYTCPSPARNNCIAISLSLTCSQLQQPRPPTDISKKSVLPCALYRGRQQQKAIAFVAEDLGPLSPRNKKWFTPHIGPAIDGMGRTKTSGLSGSSSALPTTDNDVRFSGSVVVEIHSFIEIGWLSDPVLL